jgi:hypothetical protein
MSYKRKTYNLRWPEGHVHHGLFVKLRGLSIKDLNTVQSMRGMTSETDIDDKTLRNVLGILSRRIVEWNLTDDDGNVIPHDVETLADEDFGMIMDVLNAWTKAVTSVPAPLGERSTSGAQFQEQSIPMETL